MQYGVQQYGFLQYGQAGFAGPRFRAQSPAPGQEHVAAATTVYAEVYDPGGDLDASTVKLRINGTLAWTLGRAAPGFSVALSNVDDGHGYLITLPEPFEQGVQTVSGVASDAQSNRMDESYSFTTVAFVPDIGAEAAIDQRDASFDLLLDAGHDVSVSANDLELVAGADEVAQRVLVGLRLFLAEWYLDDGAGVPYFSRVLVNAPSSRTIETVLRREILSNDGIEHLREFSMDADNGLRKLSVAFTAVSSFGDIKISAVLP